MTRFWITIEQGVAFVLSSLAMMRGGEIFVPKIPSMRIVDLARTMAPGLPHDIVGIRPGEKLHELLTTEDDARMMVEFDDRYVILSPLLQLPDVHLNVRGAKPVPEGFRYSSDLNPEWLDEAALARLIANQAQ
jgi:UDP-N-acetylglucosamine 4,6-dehydratase/5-epimerase